MRIDADKALIKSALETTINQTAMRIEKYRALLESLNPRGILERGYAIVYDKNGNVVVSSTKAAGSMSVEFADGAWPWKERADFWEILNRNSISFRRSRSACNPGRRALKKAWRFTRRA